jgi:hypothetical protein
MPRTRTPRAKQDLPISKSGRGLRIPGWVKVAAGIGGWVAALLLGLLDLPAKINSFIDEKPKAITRIEDWLFVDKTLSGKWSSAPEGDVIAKPTDPRLDALEGAPVDVELHVYRGAVEGMIGSAGLGKHYVFSQVQIEGQLIRGIVDAIAWDVIGGEKVALAKFQLEPGERGGEAVLMLRVVKQAPGLFPERAILWRTEATAPGEINLQFFRAIRRGATKSSDEATDSKGKPDSKAAHP